MSRTIRTILKDQEPLTAPATMTVGEAARLMKKGKFDVGLAVDGDADVR